MIEIAKKAAELVMNFKKDANEEKRGEYLRAVRNLGPMIIQNGLAGALLFAKKKDWPSQLFEHVDELVQLLTGVNEVSKKVENGSIFHQDYLRLQLAALEGVKWLKRYSEIILGGEEP